MRWTVSQQSSAVQQSMESRNEHVAAAILAATVGTYREWRVSGPVAGHLACTWMHALPPSAAPVLRVVPDGCVDILWIGNSLHVAGPDTRPIFETLPPGALIVGMRFLPGAAPAWLGVPASEIVNGRLPLENFWGCDARRLAEQLCEAESPIEASRRMLSALLARRPTGALMDPTAPAILNALSRDDDATLRLPALAANLGLAERTLRRRCEIAFGYGPKTLDRILRFQRFLRLLRRTPEPRLAELAAACGFADQAHLTREVGRLGGLTPGGFATQLAA